MAQSRTPHQQRALALLEAAVPRERIVAQKSIPDGAFRIDALVEVEEGSPTWGWLREEVAHRQVAIEHFSRPPSVSELSSAFTKVFFLASQWWNDPSRGQRPPMLLVLSVGCPRKALRVISLLKEERWGGVYEVCGGLSCRVVLVDVVHLPWSPDTAYLKLFDHRREARIENLRRLHEHQEVETMVKRAIAEVIMNKPYAFQEEEVEMTYEGVLELGREQGERVGREQGERVGREQGQREAIIRLIAVVYGEDRAAELAAISDTEELLATAFELLSKGGGGAP